MFTADGTDFFTTSEAAAQLEVASSTLRGYLRDGTLPEVTMRRVGRRKQRGFTSEWIDAARRTLAEDGGK